MAKVFLSAGHGGSDPGACAYGLKESSINLTIMLTVKELLEKNGITVIYSRTKEENDPVGQEVAEANASGADVAVSFHTNAGKGDGSETYYYSSDPNGKRLAQLCESYTKAIGQNSRGIKTGDKLYFIRKTKMTAVLCECAFVDNDKDNDIIDTTQEQKKFGAAYAAAILEYLGLSLKKEEPKKEEVKQPVKTGEFKVKVSIKNLNIRKGPGTNYKPPIAICKPGVYTIVEVKAGTGSKAGWGKLSSGAGWISLDCVTRM